MIWIQDSDHSDLRFVSLCSVDTVSHQIDGIFNDVFWNAYAKLISNIKVLDKDRLLIRFKDGTEIEQRIEHTRGVKAS